VQFTRLGRAAQADNLRVVPDNLSGKRRDLRAQRLSSRSEPLALCQSLIFIAQFLINQIRGECSQPVRDRIRRARTLFLHCPVQKNKRLLRIRFRLTQQVKSLDLQQQAQAGGAQFVVCLGFGDRL